MVEPPAASEWGDLLSEFRARGGVADNVEQAGVRGLRACEPGKPFLLRVPANLRFPLGDIEFVADAIRIRAGAGAGDAERQFFERYQDLISWGGGGRLESAALVSLYDALPPELRTSLAGVFGMRELVEDGNAESIRRQFLRNRMIYWNNKQIFAPIVELARRGENGIPISSDQHGSLVLEGRTDGEIFLTYGPHDSLGIFRRHGVAVARPHAFSLPFTTKIGSMGLSIGRNVTARRERDGVAMPLLSSQSGDHYLSHLMVGNAKFPRLSRGIFEALMREAGIADSAQLFDRVMHFNRGRFLQLLGALEPLRGDMVARLRSMVLFQLEALSHCVGTCEL
ncbi:MAG TPA: hypothetical protein VGK90_08115 [Rhizomicrobium sp.]